MRLLYLLAILLLFESSCFSQEFIPPARKNFYDIVKSTERYFDSLRKYIPDSILFHEGGKYYSYLKWKHFWEIRIASFGGDFRLYYQNEKIQKSTSGPCNTSMNAWWEVGPTKVPYPVAYSGSNGGTEMGAGPIRFIRINEGTPSRMICGSFSGGLYYSTNSGAFWQNAGSDAWDKSGCEDAVFHPSNISTCYAISNGWGPFIGWSGGVYRSTDLGSGNTWQKIGDASTFGIWGHLYNITVDPVNADIGLVGTKEGLFRSTNLNAFAPTWTPFGSQYFPGKLVYDVEIKPGSTNVLYALVADAFSGENGTNWGLWQSNDFGATWTQITLPTNINTTLYPAIGVTMEFNKTAPDQLYILVNTDSPTNSCIAVHCDTCDRDDELWKYTISSNIATLMDNAFDITHGGGRGLGVAHTSTAEVVYASHVDRYRVYNNGTWTLYNTCINNFYNPPTSTYHVDIEDFVGHPVNTNEVWMANHGGVYRSIDRGQNWTNQSIGLGVAEVIGMATSYQNPEDILIGLYHDGSMLTQGGYYNNWVPDFSKTGDGDGMRALIDNKDGVDMYQSSQNGSWSRSTNSGSSFSWLTAVCDPIPVDPYILCGNWQTEGALNRVCPDTLYRTTSQEVYRSFNKGTANAKISDFTTAFGYGTYNVWKLFTGFNHRDHLYAQFFISPGHGLFANKEINNPNPVTAINSWTQLPLPTVTGPCGTVFYFSDIFVDYANPNIVYITGGSGSSGCLNVTNGTQLVYKADYTNPLSPVFTDLTYNLPNVNAQRIVLEKGSNGGMYLGTETGIYYTNNELIANGTYWICYYSNLPNVDITYMEINYKINKLRLGTNGRGVWENELYCPSNYDLTESGTYATDKFLEARHDIYSTATVPAGRTVTYRAGNLIRMTPNFAANTGSNFHAFIHPCDHAGNSFNRFASQGGSANETKGEDQDAAQKLSDEISFGVFPNPNNGSFNVLIQDGRNNHLYSILVTDVTGKTVKQLQNVKDKNVALDLENLSDGLYMVKVSTGDWQSVKKVMVRK